MTKEEILKELIISLKEILKKQEFVINIEDKISNIPGWDSLAHINIIDNIEKRFKVHFSMGEIVTLKTISDLIKLIQEKL